MPETSTGIPGFLIGKWSYDQPMSATQNGGFALTMTGATIEISADGTMTIDAPSLDFPKIPGLDISGGSVHAAAKITGHVDPAAGSAFVIDSVQDVEDQSQLPVNVFGMQLDLGGLLHAGFKLASFLPTNVTLTRAGDTLTMTYPGALQPGILTLQTPLTIDIVTPNDAEARSFHPAQADISGHSALKAIVTGAPPEASYAWTVEATASGEGAVDFDTPQQLTTAMTAARPGPVQVRFTVFDGNGAILGSATAPLSVPYFVVIYTENPNILMDENAAIEDVISVLRDGYFKDINIRFINNVNYTPANLPLGGGGATSSIICLTYCKGFHTPLISADTYYASTQDRNISVWPETILFNDKNDPDAFWSRLIAALSAKPDEVVDGPSTVKDVYAKWCARAMACVSAHEIGHVLGDYTNQVTHTDPAAAGDIMNISLGIQDLTGISSFTTDFPHGPGTFVSGGFDAMAQFSADRMTAMRQAAPRPPQFA